MLFRLNLALTLPSKDSKVPATKIYSHYYFKYVFFFIKKEQIKEEWKRNKKKRNTDKERKRNKRKKIREEKRIKIGKRKNWTIFKSKCSYKEPDPGIRCIIGF